MKTEITAHFTIREHIKGEQDGVSLDVDSSEFNINYRDDGKLYNISLTHAEIRAIITAYGAYNDAVFAASKATGGDNA